MQNVTALLLMVLSSTIVWSSNTVAATGDGPLMSNQSIIMNEYPANEEEVEEGSGSDDCD